MADRTVVHTAAGDIRPEDMGVTLAHEHFYIRPTGGFEASDPLHPDYVRNVREARSFKAVGGNTIVDMSVYGFRRDVLGCRRLTEETGVHVICSTGLRDEVFYPDWVRETPLEELEALFHKEILEGIDGTDVRAGVIKAGTGFNSMSEVEKRVMEMCARVQRDTDVPITTHCDKGTMGVEEAEVFLAAGADPTRVILGHVDIPEDTDYLKRLCDMGFNVEIDHMGRFERGTEPTRVAMIRDLFAAGYGGQILLAGDLGDPEKYLQAFGGAPGLEYIPKYFVPLLLEGGITQEQVDQMLIENPRRVFALREV